MYAAMRIHTFLKWKNKKLKQMTDHVQYYTKTDIKNLVDEIDCIKVDVIFKKLGKSYAITDKDICPWCMSSSYNIYNPCDPCDTCGYAKRHKKCTEYNSDYRKITNGWSITQIIEERKIRHFLKELYHVI